MFLGDSVMSGMLSDGDIVVTVGTDLAVTIDASRTPLTKYDHDSRSNCGCGVVHIIDMIFTASK